MISGNDEKSDEYTRKNSLRVPDFDYSSRRVYFVTINVLNRRTLFFNKEFAKAVIACLLDLRQNMQFNLYGYCLMPDHFHALIGIGEFEKDLGKICGAFKSLRREFIGNMVRDNFGSARFTII